MKSPLAILQNQFGYSSFRLEQENIINSILQKRDTFALMPTGGGKSLCYQIPALVFDGLTVVISPLIALMKDQVDALRLNGVEAAYLNSTQNHAEQEEIIWKARTKELKLLYLAPESNFLKNLASFDISLLAIDEAHCISHWGHDFRPEYLTLAAIKRSLPDVPVIALTATADNITRKDIIEKLELRDPAIFVSSFNRANIRYTVEKKQKSFDKLLQFLNQRKDESGIIYCLARNSTENLATQLSQHGFNALAYHAGMEKEQRARCQEMFLRDEVKIIVATVAFGMGIDKSNVRYVVHMDPSKNIESYYQETGRAGRDGLESEALLFYSYGDIIKLKSFVTIEGNDEQSGIILKKLDQMAKFGDLTTCRRKYLLNYFDEQAPSHCGNCDICLTEVERVDGTVLAQKVLSAVFRLQARFGAGFVVDFLRGSSNPRITDDQKALKTYGIGADLSKEAWHSIIRDLLDQGYLVKSEGDYPLLKLTESSMAVLKGGESVMIVKPTEKEKEKAKYATPNSATYTSSTSSSSQAQNQEPELFQKLKDVRRQLANEGNVPAYIVLSDASLNELATYLPQNLNEMASINGFGQIKLQRYGPDFLEVITTYCAERGLTSRIHQKGSKPFKKGNMRVS